MLVTLYEQYGCYTLSAVNKKLAGAEILVQSDWDFPGLAQSLGWKPKAVWIKGPSYCYHRHTDGTVDCPDCEKSAQEFINEARSWLDERVGRNFRISDEYFNTNN